MRQQAARRSTKEDKVVNIEDLKRYRKRRQSAQKKAPQRRSVRYEDIDDNPEQAPQRYSRKPATGAYGLPVLFALLALLALAAVLGMNVFQVHDVEVVGNTSMSAEDIVQLSGVQIGESIFKINGSAVRTALQSDGMIEVNSINRVYPDKIVLNITQRIPHGAIEYMGQYVIVDEKGIMLKKTDKLPAGQYPLIVGVPVKHSEKGKPVQSHDERSMEAMDAVLGALQQHNALALITQADFTDLMNIRLQTPDGMIVELGKPNEMDSKATWLAATLPELASQGHTKGTLYLTGGKGPVYAPPAEATNENANAADNADGGDAADQNNQGDPAGDGGDTPAAQENAGGTGEA